MHLNPENDKGYEVNYRGNRTMLWQWGFRPVARHSLVDYWEHKHNIKDRIQTKSISDLYHDKDVTRGFTV